MSGIAVLILSACLPAHSMAQQNNPQKFALVIGNSNYERVGVLKNPENDANDMAAVLQELGFTVEKVLDGNLDQMKNAVDRFKDQLRNSRNAHGFFYYAGHGVQSGGINYLLPVNVNIPGENYLEERAISAQVIMDGLDAAGNELNIVVLDACRDNPFTSRSRSVASRGLALVNSPKGSIVMYATSAGEVADDGEGRNGLFTSHLLKNLQVPELSVQEKFARTGQDVTTYTNRKQHPEISIKYFVPVYFVPVSLQDTQTITTVTQAATPPKSQTELLERLEDQLIALSSRAFALRNSIEQLQENLAREGLGLRSDIVTADMQIKDNLRPNLDRAAVALSNRDVEETRKYMDRIRRDLEPLEKFLGRR